MSKLKYTGETSKEFFGPGKLLVEPGEVYEIDDEEFVCWLMHSGEFEPWEDPKKPKPTD